MRFLLKKIKIPVMAVLLCCCFFAGEAQSSETLSGKQFAVVGLSSGEVPFYADVFSFQENYTFTMEKLTAYGSGEYYEIFPGFFCFIFTARAGMDIQYVDAVGVHAGYFIFGIGWFMIDYDIKPTVFVGTEVYQKRTAGGLPE